MTTEKDIICAEGEIYVSDNYYEDINIEIHDMDDDMVLISLTADEVNKLIKALEFFAK